MFKHGNSSESPSLQNLSDWGPKRDPLFIVIPFTAIFATIFLTGLIGNVSTCIVIARNKSMHTATNYYLFSLAISDLLLLISGLPTEMYSIWSKYPYIFGEVFCVLQGFAAETSANATVLTITAFTVERYIAICRPFLSQTMSKLSRAIKLVIIIWVCAVCLAVPQAMAFGIMYEDEDRYMCNVKRVVIPHAFLISTVLFFVTPMSLITILYILIGLQLRQSTVGPVRGGSVKLNQLVHKKWTRVSYKDKISQTSLASGEYDMANLQRIKQEELIKRSRPAPQASGNQHVVKMLVTVVVAFFICWAPFHAQRLLAIYGQSSSSDIETTFSVLTYISGVLYFLSTTINPVLYNIMSNKFRTAFKETYAGCLAKRRTRGLPQHYSNLSRRLSQEQANSGPSSEKPLCETPVPRGYLKRKRKAHRQERDKARCNSNLMKAQSVQRGGCRLVQSGTVDSLKIYNTHNLDNFDQVLCNLARADSGELGEIEIFHEEQSIVKPISKERPGRVHVKKELKHKRLDERSKSFTHKFNGYNYAILPKAVTMPNMRIAYLIKSHFENERNKHNYSEKSYSFVNNREIKIQKLGS